MNDSKRALIGITAAFVFIGAMVLILVGLMIAGFVILVKLFVLFYPSVSHFMEYLYEISKQEGY